MKIFFVHKDILLVTFSANCCLFTKGEVGLIANFANLNFKKICNPFTGDLPLL